MKTYNSWIGVLLRCLSAWCPQNSSIFFNIVNGGKIVVVGRILRWSFDLSLLECIRKPNCKGPTREQCIVAFKSWLESMFYCIDVMLSLLIRFRTNFTGSFKQKWESETEKFPIPIKITSYSKSGSSHSQIVGLPTCKFRKRRWKQQRWQQLQQWWQQ